MLEPGELKIAALRLRQFSLRDHQLPNLSRAIRQMRDVTHTTGSLTQCTMNAWSGTVCLNVDTLAWRRQRSAGTSLRTNTNVVYGVQCDLLHYLGLLHFLLHLNLLISDAFQRLPSICGVRLSFAAKCLMPNTQLQCASSVMSGGSKQLHIPPRSVTPSAGTDNTVQEPSPTLVGTKRPSKPLLCNGDQMVPGRHDSSGTSDVATTQPARSAEWATQPNKLVPKFGSLKRKPHVGPAAPSTSATLLPPAKRPANIPSTPTFQRPAQTPARRPPQASTVACQRASTATVTHTSPPTADQMQQTLSSSQRPNTAMRNCPSRAAATGGAAAGPRSGTTRITQSKGTGPFQQVPASLISDEVEDDDAFYPSTHSKRVQCDIALQSAHTTHTHTPYTHHTYTPHTYHTYTPYTHHTYTPHTYHTYIPHTHTIHTPHIHTTHTTHATHTHTTHIHTTHTHTTHKVGVLLDITYVHTHAHTCVHTYVHTYAHTYTCTYVHTHAHTHVYTCIHTHIHMYTHVHTYVLTIIAEPVYQCAGSHADIPPSE